MNITHIYHSGCLVELEHHILLFDWYQGELPEIPADKDLYVFVSHFHQDHYGRDLIWPLMETRENITYVIDRKVPAGEYKDLSNVFRVRPSHDYRFEGTQGGLYVRTLKSTDTGCAFYVEVEGKRIFHAGDLNVWFWKEDSEKENQSQVSHYRKYLQELADYLSSVKADSIDLAMCPLDPRLEEYSHLGIETFSSIIDAKNILPMHYWERKDEAMEYAANEALSSVQNRLHFEDTFEV